jgi:hypothetical protein
MAVKPLIARPGKLTVLRKGWVDHGIRVSEPLSRSAVVGLSEHVQYRLVLEQPCCGRCPRNEDARLIILGMSIPAAEVIARLAQNDGLIGILWEEDEVGVEWRS